MEAVVIGEYGKEELAIIHRDECGEAVRECAAIILSGKRAVLMVLDNSGDEGIVDEVMEVTGIREPGRISMGECCFGKGKQMREATNVRINEMGAMIVENEGRRLIKCGECGELNPVKNVVCGRCRQALWSKGMGGRVQEYNRRMREALKHGDKKAAACWKSEIRMVVMSAAGRGVYVIDDGGFGVRKCELKKDEAWRLSEGEEQPAVCESGDEGVRVCVCGCGRRVENGSVLASGCAGELSKLFGDVYKGKQKVSGVRLRMYELWVSRQAKTIVDAAMMVSR